MAIEKNSKKQRNSIDRDSLKWEIAVELGLDQKIIEQGWSSLSPAESGRIGGKLANRRR